LSQTHKSLELIIIYKPDIVFDKKFYDFMESYGNKGIVVLENDEGFVNQLNQGIKIARGKYIARIDGDDYCHKNRFESQLKFKAENEYDIVGTWGNFISEEGKLLRKIKFPIHHKQIREKMMLYDPILHPSVLLEKKIIVKLGLYDENYEFAEDYELWFRAFKNGYKFGNVPEFLTFIRNNPNSITRGDKWKKARKNSLKVKNQAFLKYGFNKPIDLIHYVVSLFIFLITPNIFKKLDEIRKIGNKDEN
jgi:glycosyltransferase involved in cell wall biosynthesis